MYSYITSSPPCDSYKPVEYKDSLGIPDFVIEPSLVSRVKKVTILALKILIFPWGLMSLFRNWLENIALSKFLYPKAFSEKEYEIRKGNTKRKSLPLDWKIRPICLESDGVKYSGYTLQNYPASKQWIVYCPGNATIVENTFYLFKYFHKHGYNLLVVNGPGAGRSESTPTMDRMVDAQLTALHYARSMLRARTIVPVGTSLGAALMGRATRLFVEEYPESHNIPFIIRSMTFSSTATIASVLATRFFEAISEHEETSRFQKFLAHILNNRITKHLISCIVRLAKVQIDLVEDSEFFSQKGIQERIIQAGEQIGDKPHLTAVGHDRVILAQASLAFSLLSRYKLLPHKKFYFVWKPIEKTCAEQIFYPPEIVHEHCSFEIDRKTIQSLQELSNLTNS